MMGWAFGTNNNGREVGYGVEAICDWPGCEEQISRGVGECCGGLDGITNAGMDDEPYCGGFFCGKHLFGGGVCGKCLQTAEREWDYWPQPDGEPFEDKDDHTVVGWHPRSADQDPVTLAAEFEAYHRGPLVLRPILARFASEVECKINGWEEGTFVRCTERAKKSWPMWQIEEDPR